MKNLFFSFLLLSAGTIQAQQCISQGNTAWNSTATWLCDGVSRLPTCGDTILILGAHEVSVINQNDYTACSASMIIDVTGALAFTNGNKLDLPCGSVLSIQDGGSVYKDGAGGGSSTLISICAVNVWTAQDGDLDGPIAYGGTILPIELIDFSVVQDGAFLKAHWITASEINNDYFSLYHSTDGEHWSYVHRETGAGNSSSVLEYEYASSAKFAPGSIFRLDQTDFDGTTVTAAYFELGESSIDVLTNNTTVVYPNPSQGLVNIQFEDVPGTHSVMISDINGRMVKAFHAIHDARFSFDARAINLVPGIYNVRIGSGNAETHHKLVITGS